MLRRRWSWQSARKLQATVPSLRTGLILRTAPRSCGHRKLRHPPTSLLRTDETGASLVRKRQAICRPGGLPSEERSTKGELPDDNRSLDDLVVRSLEHTLGDEILRRGVGPEGDDPAPDHAGAECIQLLHGSRVEVGARPRRCRRIAGNRRCLRRYTGSQRTVTLLLRRRKLGRRNLGRLRSCRRGNSRGRSRGSRFCYRSALRRRADRLCRSTQRARINRADGLPVGGGTLLGGQLGNS
ncbi:hypothetical protein Mnod_0099 [Methylobacterium nodulans ORS 2060]|uniref:Uncharacterized protein n=1 Tax=Methylobacterium nodulans (strain LMG 21967 / CNCM I-2342 / ORS 2060) TaxID=460265 RepID=B8IUA1_METNO|nr:hypothetical protein Mnod_0099 [Methylobacterium nodulans ORS 2060]